MSTTRTPNICDDFSANAGDPVNFQSIPADCSYTQQNCSITQGTTTWPFNQGPPIYLPYPSTITLKSGLGAGGYNYVVSCCTDLEATKTVSIVVSRPTPKPAPKKPTKKPAKKAAPKAKPKAKKKAPAKKSAPKKRRR